jgi:hypothetical protein
LNRKNGLVTDTGSQKQGKINRQTEGRGFHLSHYFLCRKGLKAANVLVIAEKIQIISLNYYNAGDKSKANTRQHCTKGNTRIWKNKTRCNKNRSFKAYM